MIRALLLLALAQPAAAEPEPTDPPPATGLFAPDDTDAPAPARPAGPLVMPLGNTPPELLRTASDVRNQPLPERMRAISEHLLGVPYVTDPLGEGQGVDADPYARYDAFDCLTFVEQVLALSLAPDPVHAVSVSQDLRYQGDPRDYAARRHFMELQWLPHALAQGWLREATADYGPTQRFEREVTPSLWANWGRRRLFPLADADLPVGTMSIAYIPLQQASEVVARLRPGSIVMAVREDRPWVPIWVTHLGFTIPADSPTLRHASGQRSSLRTRDHDLARYVEYLGTYKNWKTAGIAVFEPREPGPRLARMPSDYEGPPPLVLRD